MKEKPNKYHKSVPQEIKDLMGIKSYKFIRHYDCQSWRNSKMLEAPVLKTTEIHKYEIYPWSSMPKDFDDFIKVLVEIQNHPDYIRGDIKEYYDYDSQEIWFDIEKKYTPTQSEIDKYNKQMIIYNEELEMWKKLEKLIKSIVKVEKTQNLQVKAEQLKKELAKIEKELV